MYLVMNLLSISLCILWERRFCSSELNDDLRIKFKVYYLPTYDCCEQLSLYVFIMYYCLLMVFVEYHDKLLFYKKKKKKNCFIFITVSEWEDWDLIIRFNSATFLCLFQARTWIFNAICHSLFCVHLVRGGC